eukprot:830808-Pleurochrysis_carterae.AAC.1
MIALYASLRQYCIAHAACSRPPFTLLRLAAFERSAARATTLAFERNRAASEALRFVRACGVCTSRA